MLTAQVDDRRERLQHLITSDLGVMSRGHIDLELLEHDAVQHGAILHARAAIELVGIFQVGKQPAGGCSASVDMGRGLRQAAFDAGSFVAEFPDFLRQFGLWPVGIGGEVEVAVFVTVDLGQPGPEVASEIILATVPSVRGLIETVRKLLSQIGWQIDGAVVTKHCRFDISGPDERQLAAASLAAPTHVVEVQIAVLVLRSRDDEAASASLAAQEALEVVVVAALAVASPRHVGKHLLDAVKEFLAHERLVSALVLDAIPLDVAQVVAVAQHQLDGMA